MSKKRYKISVILCWMLVAIILVINAVQGVLMSSFTKKSTAESYAMDCTQITNAYSLAIANKISEYMNQMTFYSNADVVSSGDDQKIISWLKEHKNTAVLSNGSQEVKAEAEVTPIKSSFNSLDNDLTSFGPTGNSAPSSSMPSMSVLHSAKVNLFFSKSR